MNQLCPIAWWPVVGFGASGSIMCAPFELTMGFHFNYLDLETRQILESGLSVLSPNADFKFENVGYLVLLQNLGVEIALLDGIAFDTVDASHIATASFNSSPINQPFDFDDTILVRTAAGNVFKVGKAFENSSFGVTFWVGWLQ